MRPEIPFIRPSVPPPIEVAGLFAEVAASNWYTNFGPQERAFRADLASYVGGGAHVATSANGTVALMTALGVSLPRGDGSRSLLMPSFTFVAVAQAAVWHGYRPWFVDVDPVTWQPDVEAARAVLGEHHDEVAGILLANVFGVGNPAVAAWEDVAREHGLPLVIDSAAGFGSAYDAGERLGLRGTCEIFSFHATKPFAVGEGGALSTSDPELAERADAFQNFGFASGRDSTSLGLNGKMSELTAAIGRRQLDGFDERVASRREVLASYRAGVEELGLTFQPNAERSSLCFASVLCTSAAHKQHVLAELLANGVQARDYYNPPVHAQSVFADPAAARRTDLSVTDDLAARMVSLPVHDHMDEDDVAHVVSVVQQASRDAEVVS